MHTKKIYFYNLNIIEKSSKKNMNQNAKQIIDEMINNNFKDNKYTNHEINPDKEITIKTGSVKIDNNKNTIDIIENNKLIFFARVGKNKDISDLAKRNKETNAITPVLEDTNSHIEIYTHFFIDYKEMIMGFVYGQGAPKHDIICNLFNEYYKDEYDVEIVDIMAEKTAKYLLRKGSVVNKTELTYSTLSASLMEDLGLGINTILGVEEKNEFEIKIVIKSKNKEKVLLRSSDKIKSLVTQIETLLDKKKNFKLNNAKLTGKTITDTKQEDFYFYSKEFTKSVSFPTTTVENGVKKILKPDKITSSLNKTILTTYKNNKKNILLLAGKQK
ncbi:hypothetical protein [Acetoanaerobium noterae]|uniref:hypothetical protein n=1 Tax=Acetoanaerobium noterae TaxID=745369 RepID=UPI0032423F5C